LVASHGGVEVLRTPCGPPWKDFGRKRRFEESSFVGFARNLPGPYRANRILEVARIGR
jgi:hypothetical protein